MKTTSFHKLIILAVLGLLMPHRQQAQNDSIWNKKPALTLIGFTDIYYGYDFNQPKDNYRQSFLFNHNRHNEFNMNLGLLKLGVAHSKYRANIALQSGTYANDNYAAEQGVFKNLFEANIGLSLNKQNNLWLDAGIFPSHLGFESAISTDNMTLTRSLSAESSPYFLSGIKLTYNPSDKLELVTILNNGWQRIQRVTENSILSLGTQVIFKPSNKVSINWSTFIGTDDPDSTRRMRYFNNLYTQIKLSDKFQFIAGFDFGLQQQVKQSATYDYWLTPAIIGQISLTQNWKTAIRAEYYQDETGVIIATGTPNGFSTLGLSWNIDYLPNDLVSCRLESRWFKSEDAIFTRDNQLTNNNLFIGASLALKFSSLLN